MQVVPIRLINPESRWHLPGSKMVLEGPLLVRRHFMDTSPTSSSAGVTWTATGWQVTPSPHTRETPGAMQVDPISLIKPQAKMTHAGIQDGDGRATSGSAEVR